MLLKVMKKLSFAFVVIYSLDLLIKNLNIFIPINYFTVPTVAALGFPGLIMLAVSFIFLI